MAKKESSNTGNNLLEQIVDAVQKRKNDTNPILHAQLSEKVQFSVAGSNDNYLFDWSGEELKVEKQKDKKAACTITLKQKDLENIISGELNPQISMLSDKITVTGEAHLATYVFNLFAPEG